MLIKIDKTGTIEGLQTILDDMTGIDGITGVMIFACDANAFTLESVDEMLKTAVLPIFGGIFPELINGKEKLTKGSIVAGFTAPLHVHTIHGLSDEEADYEALLDKAIPDLGNAQTMIVYLDGLSSRIGALIDDLFNLFGLEINYVGGGAGSLDFVQKPCLFTNDGLIQDAAVLTLLDSQSGIGVNHGWESISDRFKVTEVKDNVIISLNWKPAFEVYREVVEKISGQTFTDDNFFDIANGYPFGINRSGAERIVRAPVALADNGALVCVSEVPVNSYVSILSGTTEGLVSAAGAAMKQGVDTFTGETAESALFIDCVARNLFLEDAYSLELEAVSTTSLPLVGALTLGEIANSGNDYLEFYNNTAVIAVFE